MNFPRIVYAIRHEPTGKVYVGSTSRLPERLSAHLTALKGGYHSNEAMQKDCAERGFSYSVFVLDLISTFQDRNKEYLWIDALGSRNPTRGYNAGDRSKEASSFLFDGIPISADDICSVPAIEKLVSKRIGKGGPTR